MPSIFFAEVSEGDWLKTPESVKRATEQMLERITELESINETLTDKVNRNSQNSSQPPSLDREKVKHKKAKPRSKKQQGAQKGHRGHHQKLYSAEECQEILNHYPERCCQCGHELSGEDPTPVRYQVIDIPPLTPDIIEHRFHARECPVCGIHTRAYDSDIVDSCRYGARLCALVGLLSSEYRQSHRMVVRLLAELYELDISVGSVSHLRAEISEAVASPVSQAQEYVRSQGQVGMDETSFSQGNGDGNNPTGKRGWLWVIFTPFVCYFQVFLSRSQESAKQMLGIDFPGIVNSDRYSGYNWLPLEQRQVCWAHLKRDFTKISERSGKSQQLGESLLAQHQKLFELWHRVRDGTLNHSKFAVDVMPLRTSIKTLLSEAAESRLTQRDKSPWAKTVRTCRQLLKVEPALWLFTQVEGIEPTNNQTEQSIRPAVLWRRCSYGSQSAAGSLFVGRMMTVVTSLRAQGRNLLNYLAEACQAKRQGTTPPSLLPLPHLIDTSVVIS